MVTTSDLIKLPITKLDVIDALNKALSQTFTDNLRSRPKTVQLDCKIRGYLGEIALKNWFTNNGIHFSQTNYLVDGSELDIDLAYEVNEITYNLETKTSLVPDNYKTLSNSIERCDIKLIKRATRIEDLEGDMHLQIYFNFLRKERDTWLTSQSPNWNNISDIYATLQLDKYIENTYFVGWIDKPTLIIQINSLPVKYRTWTFPGSQKYFWACNIKNKAKCPIEIISYVKSL